MFSRTLFSVLFALSLAMPATAKSVFYVCDLDTKRAMNWVSPTMGIVFDAAKGSSVVDGLTLHYLGGPVAARARKRDDIVRLTWTISGAEDVKKHTVARFA